MNIILKFKRHFCTTGKIATNKIITTAQNNKYEELTSVARTTVNADNAKDTAKCIEEFENILKESSHIDPKAVTLDEIEDVLQNTSQDFNKLCSTAEQSIEIEKNNNDNSEYGLETPTFDLCELTAQFYENHCDNIISNVDETDFKHNLNENKCDTINEHQIDVISISSEDSHLEEATDLIDYITNNSLGNIDIAKSCNTEIFNKDNAEMLSISSKDSESVAVSLIDNDKNVKSEKMETNTVEECYKNKSNSGSVVSSEITVSNVKNNMSNKSKSINSADDANITTKEDNPNIILESKKDKNDDNLSMTIGRSVNALENIANDTIKVVQDLQIEDAPLKDDSDDCGYHSSDFEFISEEEAKKDCLVTKSSKSSRKQNNTKLKRVINRERKDAQKRNKIRRRNVKDPDWCPESDDSNSEEEYLKTSGRPVQCYINTKHTNTIFMGTGIDSKRPEQENINLSVPQNNEFIQKISQPKRTDASLAGRRRIQDSHGLGNPGPSKTRKRSIAEDFEKWRLYQLRNRLNRQRLSMDFSYRDNHRIYHGDEYNTLFDPTMAPLPNSVRLENKSTVCKNSMFVEYQGVGFEMQLLRNNEREDEGVKQDAIANAKKILELYPEDNTRRRRRF